MTNEPLKDKRKPICSDLIEEYARNDDQLFGGNDIKSAVELVRTKFKKRYGSLYLLNHKENKFIDKIIKNIFPDLYPKGSDNSR